MRVEAARDGIDRRRLRPGRRRLHRRSPIALEEGERRVGRATPAAIQAVVRGRETGERRQRLQVRAPTTASFRNSEPAPPAPTT